MKPVNEVAREFVKPYFRGKVDLAGVPYFEHLEAVAKAVAHYGPEYEAAGYLHDILEDCSDLVTEDDLLAVFPVVVVAAVIALTKKKNEPYMEYLKRVKADRIALKVKLEGDIPHNEDIKRLKVVTEVDLKRLKKYEKAKAFLME